MYLSKSNTKFNISRFFLLTFYHLLALVFNYPIADIFVFVFEGFSTKLLFNIMFIGFTPSGMMSFMMQTPFLVSLYFIYMWNEAVKEDPDNVVPLNLWDFCHIITLILCRAIVVGVKYGSYSDESFEILRKIRLPLTLLSDALVFSMINKKDPFYIEEQIKRSLKTF